MTRTADRFWLMAALFYSWHLLGSVLHALEGDHLILVVGFFLLALATATAAVYLDVQEYRRQRRREVKAVELAQAFADAVRSIHNDTKDK